MPWFLIYLYKRYLCTMLGEGNGNPLQYSCLENPMGRRAWWAAVYGVAKSWTWLSNFTFTFHFHALEKEMATHCSVFAWRIPGTGEPGGLPSLGSHRVGHDWSDLAAAACRMLCIRSTEFWRTKSGNSVMYAKYWELSFHSLSIIEMLWEVIRARSTEFLRRIQVLADKSHLNFSYQGFRCNFVLHRSALAPSFIYSLSSAFSSSLISSPWILCYTVYSSYQISCSF